MPTPKSVFDKTILLGTAAWKGFSADNCTQMAAAVGYYMLFALVPLTVFAVSVLGVVIGTDRVQEKINQGIVDYLGEGVGDVSLTLEESSIPSLEAQYGADKIDAVEVELAALNKDADRKSERQSIATQLHDGETVTIGGVPLTNDDIQVKLEGLVADGVRSYVKANSGVSVLSLIFLVLACSALFSAMNRSLNRIWKTPAPRPMVQQKLFDLAMLLGAGLLLLTSLVASGVVAVLRANLEVAVGQIAWSLLLFVVPLVVSFVFCLFTFRYVPRAAPAMRDVWPGALVAACGFEGLKFGYTFYLVHFSSYDAAFGALGSVLILLFFTYLAFQIFYLGAEVAHAYPAVRDGTYVKAQPRVPAGRLRPRDILFGLVAFVLGLFIAPRDSDYEG